LHAEDRAGRASSVRHGCPSFPIVRAGFFGGVPDAAYALIFDGGNYQAISNLLHTSMAAPSRAAVENGVDALVGMNCLTLRGELTVLGRAVAAIPVQPMVAKMLLAAGVLRVIKPCAVVAAFLSLKSPFVQTMGQGDRDASKKFFDDGLASDHFMVIKAYTEWRKAVARGEGEVFCDTKGLSLETMEMAYMMVGQFVNFMIEAGYDGSDVDGGDPGEVQPVKGGSRADAMVRAALVMGFQPQVAALYRGDKQPYWYHADGSRDGAEVSPFLGSCNKDYPNPRKDGDEWMVFSDAMKMGRFNSIMDSTLVSSSYIILLVNALMTSGNEIRFGRWWAKTSSSKAISKMIRLLRTDVQEQFAKALGGRNLAEFPKALCDDIYDFISQPPLELAELAPCPTDIAEECIGHEDLNTYVWQCDDGES